jgi:cell division protein ZapD
MLYEYPFNEGIRTMLRLEHLFDRMGQLIARDAPVDHHFALATMFEVIEVAARADLKSDLLKELDRQRQQMHTLRGNPGVEQGRLESVLERVDSTWQRLNALPGKAGADLTTNEWLMGLRSRLSIPGGTCEFDLPAYFAWQHREADVRRSDILRWMGSLNPFAESLNLLLGLLREGGVPSKVMAVQGQFQQSLPTGKTYQLMRVRMLDEDGIVPEISGHRLMASVRLMQPDVDGRLQPAKCDRAMELTLCA